MLFLQILLYCLLFLLMVKLLARDSGRNCLYFYPQGYLEEAQKRGLATVLYLAIAPIIAGPSVLLSQLLG